MAEKYSIEDSVIRALRYSNIFSYPLSFYQIGLYMDQTTSYEELQKALRQLVQKKVITKKRTIYRLRKEKCVNWTQKQAHTKKLFKEYAKQLKRLEKIPWIHLLSITGSLAAANPQEKDDIDIFLVTKENRLWLTRFFVVLYLKIWGLYRTDETPSGKICPNLLISEKNLTWTKEKQNLFVAAEIVRMQPVINRNNAYERFLSQNNWIQKFFPNFKFEKTNTLKQQNIFPNILDFLEKMLWISQKSYMQKKVTSEEVKQHFIHFNRNDKMKEILEKYQG